MVRRVRLRLSRENLARETVELSPWQVRSIEDRPERARVCDVALLDATLKRLERGGAGKPALDAVLATAIQGAR